MNTKKPFSYSRFFLSLALLGLFGLGVFRVVWAADSVSQLSDDAKKRADELQALDDKLKAQIKAYENIISLKNRQGATLDDQIKALEAQSQKIELEIEENKKK